MTRILAVIDPTATIHHALERCNEQPPESDLDILAVLFIEYESAENFSHVFTEKTKWLKEQVEPYLVGGRNITTEVIPFHNLYETVIETAARHQSNFVVKPMRQHSLFQSVIRTSTDWNLIRHCPYPLLLVSELKSVRGKPVLAAIDVCSGEENHEALNEVVMNQTIRLAEIQGAEPQVVNACRTPTAMMAVGSVDSTPFPTPANLYKEHLEATKEIAGERGITQTYIEEGSPAFVINQVANEINAGVIVIGTVARTGLSGALIGNTAEGVLESANCDVLVVKLPE